MSEEFEEIRRRLVVERKRDGRCRYDEDAKAELVAVCARPGTSVSRVARECGVNANQLSRWIRERRQRQQRAVAAPPKQRLDDLQSSFVPVTIQTVSPTVSMPKRQLSTPPPTMSLQVCLPNGVSIDVRDCDLRQAGELLQTLGGLRCSASMKG